MAKKQEYKLPANLEALIGNANNEDQILQLGRLDPTTRNYEFREGMVQKFNGDDTFLTHNEAELMRILKASRDTAYQTLDSSIDDKTFAQAKAYYMPQLTDTKESYYVNALKTLAERNKLDAPKDASKELKEAIAKIKIAHKIEELLGTEKIDEAQEIVEGNIGYDSVSGARLSVAALHGGSAHMNTRKKILMDIANAQYQSAGNTIKTKGLYGALDNVVESSEYGKAVALTSMYNTYKVQQKVNEKKAKEAEKSKKK